MYGPPGDDAASDTSPTPTTFLLPAANVCLKPSAAALYSNHSLESKLREPTKFAITAEMSAHADTKLDREQAAEGRIPTAVLGDVSQSSRFLDIKKRHEAFLQPMKSEIADIAHVAYSPDGKFIAGAATICKTLNGAPPTRLVIVEVASGHISTFAEVGDFEIQPKWSPDGKTVSFLSQIGQCCQLQLLDISSGVVTQATDLTGTIEKQCWSQDGSSILLTVAGRGADKSGCDGGVPLVSQAHDSNKTWTPMVETAVEKDSYRSAWVYDVLSDTPRQVSPDGLNVWLADWVSSSAIVGICSELPGEEHWYRSTLRKIDTHDKSVKVLYAGSNPLEALRTSPGGGKAAFVTGVASDRQIMRGELRIVDTANGNSIAAHTNGINVACLEWAGDDDIVAVGSRDDRELLIRHNLSSGRTSEIWQSSEHSIGSYYMPDVAVFRGDEIRCAFVRHGWFSPPTVVDISCCATNPAAREIKVLSSPELQKYIASLGSCESIKWQAPDGLEIFGYFLKPSTPGPHPAILSIHGGPVWQWRPRYLGSSGNQVLDQVLLAEGFALFKPNVRGSSGRGQAFSRHVYGDMGGQDTYDYLSGLDALVESGRVDAKRLGVTGASYGGFMSSWLVTQTDRFAAAVPVAPVTDWVSFQYTTHIAQFSKDFLDDDPHNAQGKFFTRSPLHHVRNVKTPTMVVCGTQDKNTPPGQALEFHRALVAHGKDSLLLTYPEEGHGIRKMPAVFDFAARTVEWFKHYL